jgi:hypothetical protein
MRVSRGVVAVLLSALCACGVDLEEEPAPVPDHRPKVNGTYDVVSSIRVVQRNGDVETSTVRDTLTIANESAAPPGLRLTLKELGCGPRARMDDENGFSLVDTTCPLATEGSCAYSWNFREGQGTKPTPSTLQITLQGKLLIRCSGGQATADLFMTIEGVASGQ